MAEKAKIICPPPQWVDIMNMCLKNLEGVEVYVDDIVIFSDTWEEHLKRPEEVCFGSNTQTLL